MRRYRRLRHNWRSDKPTRPRGFLVAPRRRFISGHSLSFFTQFRRLESSGVVAWKTCQGTRGNSIRISAIWTFKNGKRTSRGSVASLAQGGLSATRTELGSVSTAIELQLALERKRASRLVKSLILGSFTLSHFDQIPEDGDTGRCGGIATSRVAVRQVKLSWHCEKRWPRINANKTPKQLREPTEI